MKFLHLGDLHIGKRVNEFPMIEDQRVILQQILEIALRENISGVIIAGDIYDKSVPSTEAIALFENFIEQLVNAKIKAFIVSGNHDSAERLSAFSNLISNSGIYIAKSYSGKLLPVECGEDINIWLLPFIRPADVRRFHPDVEIGSYNDAVQKVLDNIEIDNTKTNILVAHQFVIANGKAPETSDSEVCSLGTLDSVDYSLFNDFDYVALGHIHKPQSMGRKQVRYCGSPLKYSFSEVNHKKSVSIIEVNNKNITVETVELEPLHDMKEVTGDIISLLKMDKDESYMHITLTDSNVIDAKSKLENIFPNIMQLDFEESDVGAFSSKNLKEIKEKSLVEHFSEFFEKQTANKLNEQETEVILNLLENSAEANE